MNATSMSVYGRVSAKTSNHCSEYLFAAPAYARAERYASIPARRASAS